MTETPEMFNKDLDQDQMKRKDLWSSDEEEDNEIIKVDYSEFDYEFDNFLDTFYEFEHYYPGLVERADELYYFIKHDLLEASKDQHPFAIIPDTDIERFVDKFITDVFPDTRFTELEFRKAVNYLCRDLM